MDHDSTTRAELTVILSNNFLTLTSTNHIYTITLHHKGDNPLDKYLLLAMQDAYCKARETIVENYGANGACLILTGEGNCIFSSVSAQGRVNKSEANL